MILLNALQCASARLLVPCVGAWSVDLDVELGELPTVPTGPALVTLGTTVLVGTVDETSSARFGTSAKVRVLGGGGGWRKTVPARHYHNPAGLPSPVVITTTAAEVGEKAIVAIPDVLGLDYARAEGPAWEVLRGRSWWVDFQGITQVAPRVPKPIDPTAIDVLTWDGEKGRAEIACDEPFSPGAILVDPRFGTITVTDLELTFDGGGVRGSAWCRSGAPTGFATSRLAEALVGLVQGAIPLEHLKLHRYRVIVADPSTHALTLQAMSDGAPDAKTFRMHGAPGVTAQLAPGSEVVVAFVGADPTDPVAIAYQDHTGKPLVRPIKLELDATTIVAVGLGTFPVCRAPALLKWAQALVAALDATPATAAVAAAMAAPTAALVAGASSSKLFTE